MSTTTPLKNFRLRSFVRRNSRGTAAQARAHADLWPQFGLSIENGMLDVAKVFARTAPTFLEIGFGTGQSLLEVAKQQPDKNFIGVETHKPGIGALFIGVQEHGLTNLRVYYADVIDVLAQAIPNESLDGIQIFFPDPWQKRRHHARRLIQPEFIKLILSKLKANGSLHLATDWDDYSKHMLSVLTQEPALTNLAGENSFSARSPFRPTLSKFERRAVREKRTIWELQFSKKGSSATS